MGQVNHTERKHALLSASGSSRWINCTPSPRLEENFEEGKASAYAAEGTLAHEFGDLGLQKASKRLTAAKYNRAVLPLRKDKLYTDEMESEVQKYIDYVMEEFKAAKKKTPDAHLSIEERIDLTAFIEDGFGTGDAGLIADGVMEVIDLKYGKGVRVSSVDNSQLKLYGLGMLYANELSFDIKTVKLTIVQPRLDHISSWEIDAQELREWGEQIVKPKAALAYEGKGQKKAGSWCRWCKAKARCRAYNDQNLAIAKHEFKEPDLLTDEELLAVYNQISQIQDWANTIGKYVLDEALKGKKWEGLKIVEGRSNRKWLDDKKVVEVLVDNNFATDKFMVSKLAGITAIEKLVTKKAFPELLGPLVIKPQGKPTLAPIDDKRPAMGIEQAQIDFKE